MYSGLVSRIYCHLIFATFLEVIQIEVRHYIDKEMESQRTLITLHSKAVRGSMDMGSYVSLADSRDDIYNH